MSDSANFVMQQSVADIVHQLGYTIIVQSLLLVASKYILTFLPSRIIAVIMLFLLRIIDVITLTNNGEFRVAIDVFETEWSRGCD